MNINNGNEQIFIKGREIASKKYVDDNKYTLPLASNETLGGIIADSGQFEHYVKEEEI